MGEKRSAISKSMKKRVSGTHVSGLSSTKATGTKKKDSGLKYGQLSRKQKQDLEDYGELVPQDFEIDQQEDENITK